MTENEYQRWLPQRFRVTIRRSTRIRFIVMSPIHAKYKKRGVRQQHDGKTFNKIPIPEIKIQTPSTFKLTNKMHIKTNCVLKTT